MSRFPAVIVAAAAALAPVPALAQAADQDVRCLLAANLFAKTEKDVAKKQIAAGVAIFFLGRTDARLGRPQLKTQLVAQAKALTPQSVGPTMNGCVKQFQAKQVAMDALGKEIGQAQAAATPKK